MKKRLDLRMITILCAITAWGGLGVVSPQAARASSDYDPRERAKMVVTSAASDQVEEFTRIIDVKLKTEFSLAYVGRADAYRRRGEIDAAIGDYTRAIELKPDYAKAYAWRGYGYGVKRDDQRAAQDFARAIELDRSDPLPYSCRGLASIARGSYDSAIADFNKAIEMKPANADDYANRALAYCCKNDYARAVEDYSRAIELRPTDAELYAKRAEAKRGLLKSTMEQVVVDVKMSERLGGRVDHGLVSEMSRLSGGIPADVLTVPQQTREIRVLPPVGEPPPATAPAFKTFETTPMIEKPVITPAKPPKPMSDIRTPPADLTATIEATVPKRVEPVAPKVAAPPVATIPEPATPPKVELPTPVAPKVAAPPVAAIPEPPKPARVEPAPPPAPTVDVAGLIAKAKENSNLDEQVKLLASAIQLAPESADARTARGDAYMMKGDYDLAISDYSRSIELRPSIGTPYNNRGVAFVRKGDHARAMQDFDKAIELNPTLAGAFYNRADANMFQQSYDRAIVDFGRAIELKPDDPDAYQGRAMAYYQKQSYDQAWADVMMCRRHGGRVQPEFEAALSRAASQPKSAPVATLTPPKAETPVKTPAVSDAPVQAAAPRATETISANPQAAAAFKQARASITLDEQIACYTKAIEADRQFAAAYLERAATCLAKGDTDGAILDCTKYLDLRPADAQAYALRGNARGKRGDSQQALDDLSKAIDLDPRNADTHYDRAMAYYDLRAYDKALADTQTCQKLGGQVRPEFLAALNKAMGQPLPAAPDLAPLVKKAEPSALPDLVAVKPAEEPAKAAVSASAEQLLAEAQNAGTPMKIELYSKAIEVDPNCVPAYAARGDLYYAKGNYAGAIYDFGKLLKLQPQNAEIYFARGQANLKNGDTKGALQDFTRAVELKPDYTEAYQNRAMLYSEQHSYNEAMADVQKTQKLGAQVDPDFVSALSRVLRVQTGSPAAPAVSDAAKKSTEPVPSNLSPVDDAISKGLAAKTPAEQIQFFNKAVQLDPKNANAFVYRGDAYCQQGDSERGISDYNQAILLNPKLAVAYNNRGVAWTARGEMERAMWDFNDALQRDPSLSGAYYNRAQAFAKAGKFDQAIPDFTRFIELKPDNAGAYKNRAIAYYNLRAYDKAWDDLDACVKLGGKIPADFVNTLTTAAPQLARTVASAALAPTASQRTTDERYQDALALLQGGAYNDAAAQFEALLQAAPTHAMTHLALGQIYSRQPSTKDKARAHYAQFLQLRPDDPKSPEVRRWLDANP
ncbi:MAG: tetratricopeptide repeat protein [Verrucomicrobia bacterium]|nr:tetratricopeptide repeat protein [Verrucomicrobiota bacterium]